jgi:hypothetical protein
VPLRQLTHVVRRAPLVVRRASLGARFAAPSQRIRATKRLSNSERKWLVRGSSDAPQGGSSDNLPPARRKLSHHDSPRRNDSPASLAGLRSAIPLLFPAFKRIDVEIEPSIDVGVEPDRGGLR